jgi:hypothetical protein
MNKKSLVTVAQPANRTWDWQGKTFHVHQIAFANGDSGEYSSVDQQQTKFVVGQEADYTIEANSNPQYPAKIKPYTEQKSLSGGGGYKKDPATQRSIERQQALKLATECIDIKQSSLNELFVTAEQFYKWITKSEEEAATTRPDDINKLNVPNDLPFD